MSLLDETQRNLIPLLRNIPRDDRASAKVSSLTPELEPQAAAGLLAVLRAFRAVDVDAGPGDISTWDVRATSQSANYFLASLAAYFEEGLPIVENWQRSGVGNAEGPLETVLQQGSNLVYVLEHERISRGGRLPTRRQAVSVAVIKARLVGKEADHYLVQYDDRAKQFQLIGGRQRENEAPIDTLKREVCEELPDRSLSTANVQASPLLAGPVDWEGLSRTYGAYTAYCTSVFSVQLPVEQLKLGPGDRWVTLDEIARGETDDGIRLGATHLSAALDSIKAAPLSLRRPQRAPVPSSQPKELRPKSREEPEPSGELVKWRLRDLLGRLSLGSIGLLAVILWSMIMVAFGVGREWERVKQGASHAEVSAPGSGE